MRYSVPLLTLLLLGASVAAEPVAAQPNRARQGVQSGEVRSLDQILNDVRRTRPGNLADVEGPNFGPAGDPRYRLKWLTPDGRVLWLDTDARTGRVLGVQGDDGPRGGPRGGPQQQGPFGPRGNFNQPPTYGPPPGFVPRRGDDRYGPPPDEGFRRGFGRPPQTQNPNFGSGPQSIPERGPPQPNFNRGPRGPEGPPPGQFNRGGGFDRGPQRPPADVAPRGNFRGGGVPGGGFDRGAGRERGPADVQRGGGRFRFR